MTDPAQLSATQLVSLYRHKALSPVEATEAALARIEAHGDAVNAFCHLDPDSARASARAAEARWQKGAPLGPIDGVPTTVKDTLPARGWPLRRGSFTTSEEPVDVDAPVTSRLREAGAVLLGKTTTPEHGWKGVTDSPVTGITRNPWDLSRTPGGSSGGAAAAAALGMGALHLGTDGGGSIRMPCGFTGVFGIKPTFGRVPAWPPSPFASVSHIGPMTRTVADAALMLTEIARPDPRDWSALPPDGRDYRVGLEDGVVGLRIAYSKDLGHAAVDPEIAALVAEAVAAFAELGAIVEEVDPPLGDTRDMFHKHWYVGAATMLARFTPEQRARIDPGLLAIGEAGAAIPLVDVMQAQLDRLALGTAMNEFHETWDLLLTPTLPIPAFRAGDQVADPSTQANWIDWTPFTYPFNLTRQPAASVPCGFTGAGLPAGLQIVGPMFGDALVLRAARAFETLRPFVMPDAPKGVA